MNANQRQSILDAIVEFEKTDFETPFKDKYKDTETFDSIVIADKEYGLLKFNSKDLSDTSKTLKALLNRK